MEIDKRLLRKEIRARLSQLSPREKAVRGKAFCDGVKTHPAVCGARVVALFSPLADEPQISALVSELSREKLVVVPRVEGDIMQFYPYNDACMNIGAFGILEPSAGKPVSPCDIDVMVVPGVAFTSCGNRMGRGKGFYDKYMSQAGFRAFKLGVCHVEQLVDELPVEPHDIKMNAVIYE